MNRHSMLKSCPYAFRCDLDANKYAVRSGSVCNTFLCDLCMDIRINASVILQDVHGRFLNFCVVRLGESEEELMRRCRVLQDVTSSSVWIDRVCG
jgi:hypothetical protein